MKRAVIRIRGVGYIMWHARHMLYHLLFGAIWAWVVFDQWGISGNGLVVFSLLGAVLPDVEHILFFITYGKKDSYTAFVKAYIKNKDWRVLIRFLEQGHKYNTKLQYHNIYVLGISMGIALICFFTQFHAGFVFFGSISIHYWFDIVDDLAMFGKLNSNWFRWGRSKKTSDPAIWKELDKTIDR